MDFYSGVFDSGAQNKNVELKLIQLAESYHNITIIVNIRLSAETLSRKVGKKYPNKQANGRTEFTCQNLALRSQGKHN